ncbi:MAG: ATP phosphoribosyltransferase regulatory subunit, partial [Porticoccaceae bacterium]|nr:ATP phosphoribosyltransferase regulatory subunit [Porticoccaceae bacterium]
MVVSNRWILPDGVVDVLPAQAQLLEAIRGRMLKLFDSWGYDLVIPPMLEFTDSLHSAAGEDLELLTFRTVDPLSGKTMGVRPDITPQIARIDAHSLRREGPARLCYAGTVLHTRARDVLSSRTPISIGLELFGETSI